MSSPVGAIVILGAGRSGRAAVAYLMGRARLLRGRSVVLIDRRTPVGLRVRAELIEGTVERVDAGRHQLLFRDGRVMTYDKLVVAVGGVPDCPGEEAPGMQAHALRLDGPDGMRLLLRGVERQLARSRRAGTVEERRACRTFVIVGAGPGLTSAAHDLADALPALCRRQEIDPADVRMVCLDVAPRTGPGPARLIAQELARKGVERRAGIPVAEVTQDSVRLQDGQVIPTYLAVWLGHTGANELLARSGFPVGEHGGAKVDRGFRAAFAPDVYVVGKCAEVTDGRTGRPAPYTARDAATEGRLAARAILADLRNERAAPTA